MKKILNYTLLFLLISMMVSCKKDYLEEAPRNALSGEEAITDLSKAKAAVGGVYATFQNDDWAGSLYISQASKAGFVRWNVADYDMSYTQVTRTGAAPWTSFYRSLNAANFAIAGISKLSDAAITKENQSALVAEARCLRAWIHANIFWNYGHWWGADADTSGLIYRDEVIDLKNIQKARITVGESYTKIYEDLDFAIANLPDFTSPRFMSKQFAKVLKAKLLLYRGGYRNTTADLQASLALVNDVLANHPSSFALESDLKEVYAKSWDSKENLFVKYLENDGTRTSKGGYYYTYYLSQIAGTPVVGQTSTPLAVGGTITAGLNYGLDWFKADPRWPIVTGPVRSGETWDVTYRWTFKKVARYGSIEGKTVSPIDEKYAAYYFRFAELYLMKAELLAKTGASIDASIAPINELRSKRTNPALPALTPTTAQELNDLIFKEIFFETFLENGSEFFASLRFKNNGQLWISVIKPGVVFNENKLCWPIPDSEMINNSLATQNPDLK